MRARADSLLGRLAEAARTDPQLTIAASPKLASVLEAGGARKAKPDAKRRGAAILDCCERAGWSAGQVFFASVILGGADVLWKMATTLAIGAAIGSIILTAQQYATRLTALPFWPDLVVRLEKTFLASLAAFIVGSKVIDATFHWPDALNIAAVATLGALGKGLLARGTARFYPNPSTLPTQTYLQAIRAPRTGPAVRRDPTPSG